MKHKKMFFSIIFLCAAAGISIFLFVKDRYVAKDTSVHTDKITAPAQTSLKNEPETPEKTEAVREKTEETDTELPLNQEETKAESVTGLFEQPKENQPVIQETVIPHDLYVTSGSRGKFKAYHRDATDYLWKYYDEAKKDWQPVSENASLLLSEETDELNRKVSLVIVPGEPENDGLLISCQMKFPDDYEPEKEAETTYQASFSILKKEITSIHMPEDFMADAGAYLSSLDIPVTVTYDDHTEETVTGLSDLFFCVPQNVESDMEKEEDGTTVETITSRTKESEYCHIKAGENTQLLKYRGTVPALDMEPTITGTDLAAPEIRSILLSDYTVSNKESEPVKLTATIDAKDNYSSLTKLSYAFLEEGKEPAEEDYSKTNKFDLEITRNGTWTAYVKDEAGNIGSLNQEIITVDQKAPVIQSVSLKYPDEKNWYSSNTILVEAEDRTAVTYSYGMDDMDSGWIDDNEYPITQNGQWKVKVRDAAGNESTETIDVVNVDGKPPLIISVLPKQEKTVQDTAASSGNSGTLADRVDVTVKGANVSTPESESTSAVIHTGTGTGTIIPSNTSQNGVQSNVQNSLQGSTVKSTTVKGDKGEKGERGAQGQAGSDGTSSYIHIKYAEDASGTNMSASPTDQSRYIGIYSGASSTAPSSVSSYRWSLYKGTDSRLHIRYSEYSDGRDMTVQPLENSQYMGICASTDSTSPSDPKYYMWIKIRADRERLYVKYAEAADGTGLTDTPTDTSQYIGFCTSVSEIAPSDAASYIWSQYKDKSAEENLQKQIDELQQQIDALKP